MNYPTWQLYRRVLSEAKPFWPHLLALTFLSLLSTPLSLLSPLPLKLIIDSVLDTQPLPGFLAAVLPGTVADSPNAILAFAALLVVAAALLGHLRTTARSLLKTYTGEKLVLDFRARLFHHAQRLSLAYHDAQGTSDATYRIHRDAAALRSLAISSFLTFFSSAFKLVTILTVIYFIDRGLLLVALVVTPLLFLALFASARRLRSGWHGVKRLDSMVMSVLQETLGSVRVVKAFGQEERERDRYLSHAREKLWARLRLTLLENGLGMAIGLIVAAGTAAVLFIGATHVRAGTLTLGNLILVMSYLSQLYGPLERISERVGSVQSSLASAERAFTLLDQAPDVVEKPNARPLKRAAGHIIFDKVSFAYEGGPPVLREISFELKSGIRLGIAGATGAGKTTLVSLLTRFYDPSEGRILLDGVDLRDYKLADLRKQFAIVLQEPVLFSTSIAENIAYAKIGAGEAEIIAAAKAAHAHDFITALPAGYATRVGERGMRLSGGERQRVALARAFLKDAPILVLDEPTSSVDTETERLIMAAMVRLMEGRTTLMIAHRLSTLEPCNARLLLEGGRLVEGVAYVS